MLGFIKILSKYALYGLLLAVLALGLILFVWWMGWPLFSVAVVVGGAGLVVLLFMAGRQLRVWFNKQRYVHHVLTTDPSLQSLETPEHTSAMRRAWERGMGVFGRSPRGVHGNAVYAQPWIIQLGGKGCLTDSVAETAASSGDPLRWHFLPDMVLLELDEDFLSAPAGGELPEQQAAWEFLLSKLLETRRSDAPEAMLATIDVRLFSGPDADLLSRRARQIHSRVRELQTLFESRIPLYVVVTGLDSLPGMASLLDSLPDAQRGELLGERFPLLEDACILSPQTCAARAVEQAVRGLRRMLLARAAEGFPPDGDELRLCSAISGLESALCAFLQPLFRLTPHVAAPLLRGIVFIAGATSPNFVFDAEPAPNVSPVPGFPAAVLADARPLTLNMEPVAVSRSEPVPLPQIAPAPQAARSGFTTELLSSVLPAERPIRQSTGQSALRGRLSVLGFSCWYMALFVFCGLAAATTVYNWHILRDAPAIADGTDNALQRLRHFEDAERRWWLPSLGLNSIAVERDAAAARFLADMRRQIPGTLSALVNGSASKAGVVSPLVNGQQSFDSMHRLLWLSEAVDLRRSKGVTASLREQPFPATVMTDELWTPAFGDTFLNYLDRENVEALGPLTASLRGALQQILGRDEGLLFERLAEFVNHNLAHKSVTLAEFWPNIPRGSSSFMDIQPIYTAAGFADLSQRMGRLYADSAEESYTAKPFWKHYLADYAAAWQAFALNGDRAWNNESTASTLESLTAETELIKTPSGRLLARMARELQPLAGASGGAASLNVPDWVNDVFLLNALVEITALTGDTDPGEKLGTLSILLGSLKTSGPALVQLREYLLATRDARGVFRAVAALREYEQSLQELRRTQLSPQGSLTLAAMHFGGKQYGDATQSACSLAKNQLNDVFRILHVRPEVGRVRPGQTQPSALSPAAATLQGQLRLSMHGVITEAALQLQRQWESGVLATAALTPLDPGPLFVEQGVVQQFLGQWASPFVERKVGGYVPRTWDGRSFPFADDFLQFVQQGQTAALVTPKDVYEVRLRSQTSAVNPEARERLQFVEVTLAGADGPVVLKNQNYPAEKVFTYKPATSGEVTLRLSFPSLTLTRTYASFPDFLQDIIYGERVFGPQDFPEAAERMELLNLTSITVRILPANAGEVLAARAIMPMPLPERITKVW